MPYVRDSFWRGREWTSEAHMQRGAVEWCLQVAGRRSHRSLEGAAPLTVFETVEKHALVALPAHPFELAVWSTPKVGPDCHIKVGKALYSVPWQHIGKRVDARLAERTVEVFAGTQLVKTHVRIERGRRTDYDDYPPEKVAFFMRTPVWCRHRAAEIGAHAAELVTGLLEGGALHHLRAAQGVIGLVDKHGAGRVDAACARALAFGDPSYRTVRGILAAGVETSQPDPGQGAADAPAHLHGPRTLFDGLHEEVAG